MKHTPKIKRIKKKKRNKQPPAVTIVAWGVVILFGVRLYQVFEPLLRQGIFENGIAGSLWEGRWFTPLGNALLSSATYLVLSLTGIVVLIGFLRLHRWAWVILIAWTGISLALSLLEYFYSQPNYVVMASNMIITFALNQADVQRVFGIRMNPDEPIA
jgi:hypothetical protein